MGETTQTTVGTVLGKEPLHPPMLPRALISSCPRSPGCLKDARTRTQWLQEEGQWYLQTVLLSGG